MLRDAPLARWNQYPALCVTGSWGQLVNPAVTGQRLQAHEMHKRTLFQDLGVLLL